MRTLAIDELRAQARGDVISSEDEGYEDCATRLQRDDRPAPRRGRSGRERRRRDGRGGLRARERARPGGAWWRAQRAGLRHVRRRRGDRSVWDARRPGGSRDLDGAGGGRGDVGRLQRRDVSVRSGDDGRDHLVDRRRRPDARRWDRVPRTRVRALDRQPPLGRRRHGRRTAGPGERARERGPVLGDPRRGRQLRRRDLARVPPASGEGDLRRADVLRAERGREHPELLPRVHRRCARADGCVPRVPDRATACRSSRRTATATRSSRSWRAGRGRWRRARRRFNRSTRSRPWSRSSSVRCRTPR